METKLAKRAVRWESGINIVAGGWLIIAPFVLGYSQFRQVMWNDIVVGAIVLVLALWRTVTPLKHIAFSWTNVVLGAWLLAAPFVLASTDISTWNDMLLGAIILSLALMSAVSTEDRTP